MRIFRGVPKAGRYAQERYEHGLSNWRSWINRVLALLFGPFIIAGVVVLIIDHHALSWFAGGITGGLMAVWLTMRDSPPAYVENWGTGAEGERRTAKALRPLERAGWQVVHDVAARYGNYDHVVVGPAGVFMLDSKNLRGIVEMRDGVPHLLRRMDPDADTRLASIAARARSAAAQLSKEIQQHAGARVWVQAAIVFWSDFPEGVVEDERCVFMHGTKLLAWLQQRPQRMGDADVTRIAAAVAGIAGRDLGEHAAAPQQLQTA